MPQNIAKAKSTSVSVPMISMNSTGMTEVIDVLIVRTMTSLSEVLAQVRRLHFICGEAFRLMRWNTTTVS